MPIIIQEKLQCKDFSWYMREIAYDIPKYWPMVQPKNQAWGVLKNEGTGLCPNSRNSKQVDYPDYLYDTEKSEEEVAFLENLYQEQIFDALRVLGWGMFSWRSLEYPNCFFLNLSQSKFI